MATNKTLMGLLLCVPVAAWSREAATPASCQAAGSQAPIAAARATAEREPTDLAAHFRLADAWSDAGCFNEAVHVLQDLTAAHPESQELATRLRVARSLVGEEHFFDNLDRADAEARLKRATFRCVTLSDVDACAAAVALSPEDSALLTAQGDAFMRVNRPAEAIGPYRRGLTHAQNPHDLIAKINLAEAQLTSVQKTRGPISADAAAPVARDAPATQRAALRVVSAKVKADPARRYSNADPDSQSH